MREDDRNIERVCERVEKKLDGLIKYIKNIISGNDRQGDKTDEDDSDD